MKSGKSKGRTASTYKRKVFKLTKWHDRLTNIRCEQAKTNPNTNLPAKRRGLYPLIEYLEKIKKPNK